MKLKTYEFTITFQGAGKDVEDALIDGLIDVDNTILDRSATKVREIKEDQDD